MKTAHGLASVALISFASPALAGDVLVVGAGAPYATIQQAIDAAADYDTILVRSKVGSYAGFQLNGRSLAIIGRGGTQPIPPLVVGESRVDVTPAGGVVVLGRIDIYAASISEHGLRTTNNSGSVWLEGCLFRGRSGTFFTAPAGPAARVQGDADTRFAACAILAGNCGYSVLGHTDGPHALFAEASSMQLIGCTITGGFGSTEFEGGNGSPGGDGGPAFRMNSGLTLAVGTSFVGGVGGEGGFDNDMPCPVYGGPGGSGGSGLVVGSSSASAEVRTRGGSTAGGQGGGGGNSKCDLYGPNGSAGTPVVTTANGTWTQLDGIARYLSGDPAARENTGASLTATGTPGDKVYLQIGELSPPHAPAVASSPMHLPIAPTKKPQGVYVGTIPASGTLETSLALGPLPLSTASMWLKLRTLFVDTNDATFYGNSFVLIVLDSSY